MSDFPSEEAILEPKRIQVFGVLHIVFGGLGLAGAVGSVVMLQFQKTLMKLTPTAPGMEEYNRVSLELTEKMAPMSYIGAVFSVALGILILMAGIFLLKRRAKGLKLSNAYAWTSLALKVVGLALFFVITKPLVDGLIDPVLAEADGALKIQLQILKFSSAAGGILSPVIAAVYPILTLVMLNKEAVRLHLK